MKKAISNRSYHEHVQAIIDETGISDPREAIRVKARAKLAEFSALFESPPYDLSALASCVGLRESSDSPVFSQDSEIVPMADGKMALRVNRERPLTRQRFSIAHEIGHTLFPDYQYSVRCRKANERRWTDDDLLETLCDVAASEFMFPLPWFAERLLTLEFTGAGLASLADECLASREATVRRIVELSESPMAAIFFSWKLKPVEIRAVNQSKRQPALLASLEPPAPAPMLRVDYSILNSAFRAQVADHVPANKSIPSEGLLFEVSMAKCPAEGSVNLDLGTLKGDFHLVALPIFTEGSDLSDSVNSSIVAVICPMEG